MTWGCWVTPTPARIHLSELVLDLAGQGERDIDCPVLFRQLSGHLQLNDCLVSGAAILPGGVAYSHWRAAGGAEVDLLLERDGVLYPFEIKLTANPSRGAASGLAAFRKTYPDRRIAKGAILCATPRPFWVTEDVAALPWNHGLMPGLVRILSL